MRSLPEDDRAGRARARGREPRLARGSGARSARGVLRAPVRVDGRPHDVPLVRAGAGRRRGDLPRTRLRRSSASSARGLLWPTSWGRCAAPAGSDARSTSCRFLTRAARRRGTRSSRARRCSPRRCEGSRSIRRCARRSSRVTRSRDGPRVGSLRPPSRVHDAPWPVDRGETGLQASDVSLQPKELCSARFGPKPEA